MPNPPNTVSLGSHVYSVDLTNYQHNSLPPYRQGVVTSSDLGDQLYNPDGGWWRYRYDWKGGADQKLADLDPDANATRFWTSTNINTQGDYVLTLANDMAEISPYLGVGFSNPIERFDGKLYTLLYLSGRLDLVESELGDTWSSSGHALLSYGGTANVQAFYAFPNDTDRRLFIVDNNRQLWYAPDTGGTGGGLITTATKNVTTINLVNNNLLVAAGNQILEILPSGSSYVANVVYEHFDEEFEFNTIFAVGSRIYVGGADEDRTAIYAMTVTSTGRLAVSSVVCDLPIGERLNKAISFSGNILLLTNLGARFATVTGDGSITYGAAINPFENSRPINAAIVGSKAYVTYNTGNNASLALLDFENFVETLLPAHYAFCSITGFPTGNTAILNALQQIIFAEKRETLFLPGGGTVEVYASNVLFRTETALFELSGYMTTGTIDSGEIYFGTVDEKLLGELIVTFEPLASGESISATIVLAGGGTNQTATQSTLGATSLVIPVSGEPFRYANVQLTLNSSSGTTTPTVTGWKLNAYPKPPTTQRWTVPLLATSFVLQGDGQGQVVSQDPYTEVDYIRDLWENRTVTTYTEGTHSYTVLVENFIVQPTKWDDAGSWLEAVLTVQLISL